MSLNLLSFVWKRQSSSQSIPSSVSSESATLPPPLVTASTSETCGEDEPHIAVPVRHAPSTPEGLRPRGSLWEVREQLALPSRYRTNPNDVYGELRSKPMSSRRLHPQTQRPSRSISPKRAAVPSRNTSSWSQGTVSSPPVSTSSFYAHSADGVATSPNLVPGQARTAVGALVAQQQQQPMVLDYSKPYQKETSLKTMNILPPPPANFYTQPRMEQDIVAPAPFPTAWPRLPDHPSLLPYQPLDSPRPSPTKSPQRHVANHSPDDSALIPSPSSLARQQDWNVGRPQRPALASALDTSFSSRAKLLDNRASDMYDIEPLPGTEVVLGCDAVYFDYDHRNMSAMSYSAVDTVISRTISEDDQDSVASGRREREDMVAQVLERLQDNVDLVTQVQALGESWFTQTPLQEDGLVTGFELSVRDGIVRNLNAILQQLDQSSEDQPTLRDSLFLCRQLVYMSPADKPAPSHRVKEGVRAALGILPPESPEVVRRGGDSSVFSLPPDDQTPMTSNVSLTTTITTHHSPPGHRFGSTPGLQLRRSMETVLSLLQVLTRACRRLGDLPADRLLMDDSEVKPLLDEIKAAYQQVTTLDRRDMKSLINAFEPVNRRAPSRPILPRAPALTPPRHAWHADDIFGNEGFEMELERRNPPNVGRLPMHNGHRQGLEQQHLHLLAGVCTRIAEGE